MALKTKSIYEPKEESDGLRILITRFYPRGVKKGRFDRWMRELSPSRELLKAYRSKEKSWRRFKSEFISEMKGNAESMRSIRDLGTESLHKNVTLLCYEPSGEHCHRYLVADLIRKAGLVGG
jgi:uncharacterized protein YeaO (DUF488 family)